MKKIGWVVVMVGFALVLLVANMIYSAVRDGGSDVTGLVVDGGEGDSSYEIVIEGNSYSIEELKISLGDSVSWRNLDQISHTVTSVGGVELDSGLISTGDVYSHVFNESGVFDYYCRVHPYMRGVVVVR